jgi:tetratricopeptide (TPR) repeat protein
MEDIQKIKQKPRGHILSIIIVAALLIAVASAFIIYRSNIGSASAYTEFKEAMLEIKKMGDDYAENDMKLQAQHYYGMAGSSVSAMRLAVDHILDMKGENKYLKDVADAEDTNVTAKPTYKDWESIAAISPASPYPYYFEGLIYHIQGNESKAKEAYQNALINPLFSENSAAFYYLSELGIDELSKIRDELAVIESDLYEVFTPKPYGLERHPMNFNDEYLRAKAKDILEKEPNEYTEALRYYTAALRINPFEAKNYACCALISIFNNDVDAAITCVNEGLWVDESNKELNQIAAWLTQNRE